MNQKNKSKNLIAVIFVILSLFFIKYSHVVYFKYAQHLYNVKNYAKSVEYLEKALFFEPDNFEYRYAYVNSLIKLPATYDIERKIFNIANDNKNDSAHMLAQRKINNWKYNIMNKIGNNYIEQAPSDVNIIRWNKNSFPLPIYVGSESDEAVPDYYVNAIARALIQWTNSIDFVSFMNVNDISKAKIIINFKPLSKSICNETSCKYVAGATTPIVKGNTLKQMTITIYNKRPDGKYLSDKEIYNVILHELGHALGIMGHSYGTSDLMYAQNTETNEMFNQFREDFHYISSNDINTMKLLYMLEPTIIDKSLTDYKGIIYTPIILGNNKTILQRKLKEAIEYINKYPNIINGYINLAGIYNAQKEYKKAIKVLQKAENINSNNQEKYMLYYNFAYIYTNLEDYQSAIKYATLAKQINNTQEISEIMNYLKTKN